MTGKGIVIRPYAIERLKREKVYKVDRNTLIKIAEKLDEVIKGKRETYCS